MSAVRKAYVDCPDGQIRYRHQPGPGTPLLLFHRTPVSSACFDALPARACSLIDNGARASSEPLILPR